MKKKTDKAQIIFWVIVGIIVIIFLSQFLFPKGTDNMSPLTGNGNNGEIENTPVLSLEGMDAFAQCITEKGATFYGTEWCGYCKNQKELFGDSLQHVNYIDCDEQSDVCISEGIRGYPTWKINGDTFTGVQQISTLAEKTGCEIA